MSAIFESPLLCVKYSSGLRTEKRSASHCLMEQQPHGGKVRGRPDAGQRELRLYGQSGAAQ
jgi:hypothetical protein